MSARVCIVSKNQLALAGISHALRLHLESVIVETASTACDALILVASHHFDAIIFPSQLPDRTGLDFLRHVKALRPDSAAFFVGDPDDIALRAEVLGQGAYAFIAQPLVIDQFIPLLRGALKQTSLHHAPAPPHRQPV
jgi:DNA-binding NarL/FixJ family response regulator